MEQTHDLLEVFITMFRRRHVRRRGVDPVGRYRARFLRLRRAPQILAGQIQLTVSSSSPESVEEGEEWWCSRPHRPFERAKMLVACIRAAPSSGSDPKAVSSSLQVTQATSRSEEHTSELQSREN